MGNFINCPTYPEPQATKFLSIGVPPAAVICDGINVTTTPCASNFDELACLVYGAPAADCDEVLVCDGSNIDFSDADFSGSFGGNVDGSYTINVPDGVKIECEGCDCTMVRPFAALATTLCPFFTTQLGGKFDLKGLSFESDGFPSEENVISFSDYENVGLDEPFDIKVESELKEAKCDGGKGGCGGKGSSKGSSKSSKKGKGEDARHLATRPQHRTRGVPQAVPKAAIKELSNQKARRVATRHQEKRALNPTECDSDVYVKLFKQVDDGDGMLTCQEAGHGFASESIALGSEYDCATFFQGIAAHHDCIGMVGDNLVLV